MRKKLWAFLMVSFLGISCAYAGAHLTVSNVTVNEKGQTFSTTCVNAKGYYFEIGQPDDRLVVYGLGEAMPMKTIVNNLLIKGWRAVFGKDVNTHRKILWMGHKSWRAWLKDMAFKNNLAVIVDWKNQTVYINRL